MVCEFLLLLVPTTNNKASNLRGKRDKSTIIAWRFQFPKWERSIIEKSPSNGRQRKTEANDLSWEEPQDRGPQGAGLGNTDHPGSRGGGWGAGQLTPHFPVVFPPWQIWYSLGGSVLNPHPPPHVPGWLFSQLPHSQAHWSHWSIHTRYTYTHTTVCTPPLPPPWGHSVALLTGNQYAVYSIT